MFWHHVPPFRGHILGYSGAYFSILSLLFENRSITSLKFCRDVLGVPFKGHCTIFFHIMTLLGILRGVFLGSFWAMLKTAKLQNCSIFSRETLYRCSWYNADCHYTKRTFYIIPSLWWGPFWGILGPFSAYLHIFLDIGSIFCHKILYRCSWYNPEYH